MSQPGQNQQKEAIRDWWADNPMTYGFEHGVTSYTLEDGSQVEVRIGSREFFELADRTFYEWNENIHDQTGRFGKIFDYGRYQGKRVLEVGCGMGCMAMNWASHGAQLTAVDLNPVAVAQTTRRMEAFGLQAEVRQADGETLPFDNDSFDFVYSWGVLHHTPRTKEAIAELRRVLKPGGRAGVMLYNRNSGLYRYLTQWVEGVVNMEQKFLTPLELGSRYGDGDRAEGNPHTWPVTKNEALKLFDGYQNAKVEVLGRDLVGTFNQMAPWLGRWMPGPVMRACQRRWGWSLWITGEKAG